MSSSYALIEEAFAGPSMASLQGGNKKKKHRNGVVKDHSTDLTEGFVPGPLPGSPDPDRPSIIPPPPANNVLTGPPMDRAVAHMESGSAVKLDDLFPLPGNTGSSDEWEKAFMLDGSVAVAGGPTLWRQAAALVPAAATTNSQSFAPVDSSSVSAIPSDISSRLETLTRQLESLTTPSPMQGTAELFLFVAIGLLLLLAIDTLLRFVVSVVNAAGRNGRKMVGGRRARFY